MKVDKDADSVEELKKQLTLKELKQRLQQGTNKMKLMTDYVLI